jgi:hypothetical protein
MAVRARFFAHVKKTRGCWVWGNIRKVAPAQNQHRYGMFSVDGRIVPAHVYSWRLHHRGAPVPRGKLVKHSCDNKRCVNPQHLSVGTHGDNLREAFARKRHPRCERVFSAAEVRKIRTLLKQHEKYRRLARATSDTGLAKKYSVGRSTIQRIKWGRYTPYN